MNKWSWSSSSPSGWNKQTIAGRNNNDKKVIVDIIANKIFLFYVSLRSYNKRIKTGKNIFDLTYKSDLVEYSKCYSKNAYILKIHMCSPVRSQGRPPPPPPPTSPNLSAYLAARLCGHLPISVPIT